MVPFSEKSEEGVYGRKASIRFWVLNLMCVLHTQTETSTRQVMSTRQETSTRQEMSTRQVIRESGARRNGQAGESFSGSCRQTVVPKLWN